MPLIEVAGVTHAYGLGAARRTVLRAVDAGFDPADLVTARTLLAEDAYAEPARVDAFYDRLLARLRAAGVAAASLRASRITRYWLVSVKMVETMRWPKAL